tara:strand:+ start:9846 stop:10103 length:258 start_codon:yes stop_codon:yes gene_type:complete
MTQGTFIDDSNHRNAISDKTVDEDFNWLGKTNRRLLCWLLCDACNTKRGTTVEYNLLMPPIEKAHQFLSRDERHRAWDGYTWQTQ